MVSAMIDNKLIDELSQRIAGGLPGGFGFMQDDLRKNIRAVIESSLKELNLVTR